jgi:hypothetical protein
MSVDADAIEPEPTCNHCATADETVQGCHLAPIGNLVAVAACEPCRRRWGTLEPPAEVGTQAGLIVGGVCRRCPPETQGDHEALYSVEQEFRLAGHEAFISVTLCPQHAREHGESFLRLGGEP